jgi:prevent-host-death family protein
MYMKRAYSIAAARAKLPALVKAAERGEAVVLARRGTPVAVVLSLGDYRRLAERGESLEGAWAAFRRRHPVGVELSRAEVDSWRQRDRGRKVDLE